MKILFILCFFSLFIISCDYEGKTEIKITNESLYNLQIKFNIDENIFYYENNEYKDIKINMNKSASFLLTALNYNRNPNKEVVKIIFINNNSGEIINEIHNNGNLFKLTKKEPYWEYYLLYINDDLLFKN